MLILPHLQDNTLVRTQRGWSQAVLCDLGLARIPDVQSGLTTTDGSFKGSLAWCSPEALFDSVISKERDIWAWGCLVLEVCLFRSTSFAQLLTNGIRVDYVHDQTISRLWDFRAIDGERRSREEASRVSRQAHISGRSAAPSEAMLGIRSNHACNCCAVLVDLGAIGQCSQTQYSPR